MSPARPRIHAVVLAGGAGTRFWPLSRESRPKPLLRVIGRSTLLEETLDRAACFSAPDRTWLVCGADHAKLMRAASGLPRQRVLVEPRMRNTTAAVAFAAARIAAEDPEAVMAVLSADHRIPDARAFAVAIRRAARAAQQGDVLVTLGVRPTRPDTGLGYIRIGPPAGAGHRGLHRVARFVEKPGEAAARRFLRSDRYLWNMGVFVWTARRILEEIEICAPEVFRAIQPLLGVERVRDWPGATKRAYRRVPALSVDKAVLERSERVWCLPVDFHWSDVGTWQSLAEELGVGGDVSHIMDGEAILCESTGNLVRADGRPVVLLGVEGLAVIDTKDVLLVADLDHSHQVRQVVSGLRRSQRRELL